MYRDQAPPLFSNNCVWTGHLWCASAETDYQSGLDVVTNIKIHKFCNIQEQYYYFHVLFYASDLLFLYRFPSPLELQILCAIKIW